MTTTKTTKENNNRHKHRTNTREDGVRRKKKKTGTLTRTPTKKMMGEYDEDRQTSKLTEKSVYSPQGKGAADDVSRHWHAINLGGYPSVKATSLCSHLSNRHPAI